MAAPRSLLCAVLFSLFAHSVAHTQIVTGRILGGVRDDSGAVLPGATVTISSPALPAGPATALSDERGQYRFVDLPPGLYRLQVQLSGFASYDESELRVLVNGTTERAVTLKLSSLSETITVSGESPVVDTRRVGLSTNIDQASAERIPTRRFGVFDYLKWTPGATSSNPAGSGAGVSVFGASTGDNSFQVDGVVFNSPSSGGAWAYPDSDIVEEIEVLSLGASAEYAHAQGAVFNVVSKSGTNTFRGDAAWYFLPDRFVSKPILQPCNCPYGETGFTKVTYLDASAHLGGPVRRDRLWFYGGYSWNHDYDSQPGASPDAPRKYRVDRPIGKITWQASERTRVSSMWRDDPWNIPVTPTATIPVEVTTENGGRDPQYSFEVNHILTGTLNLAVRVAGWWAPNDYTRPVSSDTLTPWRQDTGSGVESGGAPTFGRSTKGLHIVNAKMSKFLSGFWGADHDFKIGVQVERGNATDVFAYPGGVNYLDFNGQPDQARFRDPYVQAGSYKKQGVYAEDQFTIKRLSLSVGGRFDRMEAVSPDMAAVDAQLDETGRTIGGLGSLYTWKVPVARVGFNYKLTEDGKTILRGNYGRSYRSIFTNDYSNLHPGLSPIFLRRYDPATRGYTTLISVTDAKANLRVDPNTKAPYTDQYSLGFDRELMANFGMNLTFVRKNSRNQIGWRDIGGVYGTSTTTLPDGRSLAVFPLLNRTADRVYLRTNTPGMFVDYNGLVLGVQKRWSHGWQASASYTYSMTRGLLLTGNAGRDPNDFTNATGRTNTDWPHQFKLQGAYEVPRLGVMLSSSYFWQSGTAYAPTAQVQLPQGRISINIDVPGSFRRPAINDLALRVSKPVRFGTFGKVDVSADVLNLLQSNTVLSYATNNFFSTNFTRAATWVEPRRLMLSIKALF